MSRSAAHPPASRRFSLWLLGLCALAGAVAPLARLPGGLALVALVLGGLLALTSGYTLWILLIAGLAFSVEVRLGAAGGLGIAVPSEPLILLLALISLVAILWERRLVWPRSPLNVAVGLFVLALLASLPDAGRPLVSAKRIFIDLLYVLAGYVLAIRYTTSLPRLYLLLFAMLAANAALALYGLAGQLAGEVRIYGEVAEPFFENHCIYAAFLVLSISVALAFLFETRTRGRLPLSAALALWTLAVTLTFVRGAWLSLAAVGLFYLWAYRRQLSPRTLILAVLVGMVVVGVAGTLQIKDLFQERLDHALDTGYVTNRDRLDRWGAAAQMFLAHPINGVGWGAYADEYFSYIYYLDAYSTDIRMGAHNLYLEIAAEGGLLGLAAFALLLFVFFHRAHRLAARLPRGNLRCLAIGLAGAMLSYLVHAVVNNLGPSDKLGVSFWLILGLLVVVEQLSEKTAPRPSHARS